MIIEFDWLEQQGVRNVISYVYSILDIIKFVIPIILIVMTTFDIVKKIIDPSEKEGQQKILRRAIAALIIFFLPTIINIFFDMVGVEIPKVNTNDIKTTTNDSKTDVSSVLITNCPNSLKYYHNGDKLTLNTNITSNNDIVWSITDGYKYTQTYASDNKKSFDITFKNITGNDKVVVNVVSGGKSHNCTILIEKERLASLSYTNCPSKNNTYYVGDVIDLNTDIKESFKGDIKWSTDDNDASLIRLSNDEKKAKIDILDYPKKGYVVISTVAGSQATSCLIDVSSVKELKITNCPSSNNIYHVGDKITLNTNIPEKYQTSTTWGSALDSNIAIASPINNGKSAEIKIVGVPKEKYINVTVAVDSKVKTALCKINIEEKNNNTNTNSNTNITPNPTSTPPPTSTSTPKLSTTTPNIQNKTPTPTITPTPYIKCDAPTNVKITQNAFSAGTIKWDDVSNATDYEISIDNNNWILAYSGYNYKKVITKENGLRTVYVRSVCNNVKSSTSSKASVNVYKIEVKKGDGVNFVNGGGNYIEGETATISATLENGRTWSNWKSNTNEIINKQNYSFTVNSNKVYTAYGK